MRMMILLPLLAAVLLSYVTVSAQMTFSDHWSKKNFPSRPSLKEEATESEPMCKEASYYEMKMEWLREQLRHTHQEFSTCHRMPKN